MVKRRSKSPKKRKSLKRRKSPKKSKQIHHNDGGIFQDMYNYIHDLFYINERRVRPSTSDLSKKTPESSSKKTTQNDEITSSLASSSF